MSISCPNKKLRAYQDLVAVVGENLAYSLWVQYDGFVPESFYSNIENDRKFYAVGKESSKNADLSRGYPSQWKDVSTLSLNDNRELYEHYKLLNDKGSIKSYSREEVDKKNIVKWVDDNNNRAKYSFVLRKGSDGRFRIFIIPKQTGQKMAFQLESGKSIEEVNQALNTKLKQILGSLGIEIESIDKFINDRKIDAIGVSDIVRGIIYVDENKSNLLTLPEETAHFIIEMMGDSALAKRLLSMVEANDYYKEILGEKYDSYNERYNGNKNMLVKEAAGKLLSQALISQFDQQKTAIPEANLSVMQRLWSYVKNLFNRITKQRFNENIASAYGMTAKDFLENKNLGLSKKNLKNELVLFQISDKALNSLKDKLDKSKEAIAKRIEVYKRKDLKSLASKEEAALKKLVEDLDNKKYLTAAMGVVDSARNTFKNVTKRIAELNKAVENLELVGNDSLLALAKTLRDMKQFSNSYLPMMKEIKLELTKMSIEDPSDITVKEASSALSEIIEKAELLDSEYYEMAIPIFAKYIKPFVGDGPIADLQQALKEGGADITFMQRWVDALANCGEPIAQLIDVAVKDAKQEGKDKSYNTMKDIIDARMKLEKAGVKNTHWMYEVKKDGSLSGNNVYKFNYGDWNDARDAEIKKTLDTIRKSNKGIELPSNDKELMSEIMANDVLLEQYNRMMNWWYKNNSQQNPDAEKIIAIKEATLSTEEFNEWYAENTSISDTTGAVYYIRELSSPSNKYLSKQYQEIQNNPAKKEFYDFMMATKEDMDSLLPQNRRLGRLAPQLRTDFIEKFKESGNIAELARNAKESLKEQFQVVEDETQLGDKFNLIDETGKPVNFLPIYFTGKLDNMKNLSTDFAEGLSAFTAMANDYHEMSKIIDILELGRDIISTRPLREIDAKGNIVKEGINVLGKKVARLVKKDPSSSNLKARIDDYFLMNIYGKTRSEGKDIDILGFKINSEKALDLIGRYTSLNNLALNLYAGIQNPLVGNQAIRLEAIAGQFFDNKALAIADKTYFQHLPQNMANVGSRNAKDFLSLWSEKMEVMQDFSRLAKELNMDRTNVASKLFNQSALYFLSHAGEHQMQHRTSFALAYSTKLKDSNGKDITLLDAFDTINNKLVLKSGLTKPDGSAFTDQDVRAFKRKQNAINNSMHGIYNEQDLIAIQQYGLLRQALMFRKFMRPGYNRRFRKQYYNYEGQFAVEGYYRTFGRFASVLAKDLRHGQFLMAAHWNELTDLEKKNMFRTFTDAGYMIAVAAFIQFILPTLGGDDEDDWAAQMMAYQANRLSTELRFYIDPRQTITILSSPAAGIQQVNNILNAMSTWANPWYGSEIIGRGRWEGYSRREKSLYRAIPLVKTLTDWRDPEVKMVYLTLQNK